MNLRIGRLPSLVGLCLALSVSAQEGKKPPADPDFPDSPASDGTMEEQVEKARQGMREQVSEAQQHQADEFAALSERMEAQYQQLQLRMEAQREQLRQRVAQQWSEVQESSDKTWVDYGEKTDARSKVDFEKGEIEVEVLVPLSQVAPGKGAQVAPDQLDAAESARLQRLAEEKLRAQAVRMLAQKEPQGPPEEKQQRQEQQSREQRSPERRPPPKQEPLAKRPPAPPAPVLKDQLRGADGTAVTAKNVDKLVKDLVPQFKIDPKPVVAGDGTPRVKVTVKIPLVSGHLKLRADRYAERVNAQAQALQIDPALVFAVIHTESAFNPMARSSAGAFGLMQLIPKSAAHEAYRHLHKDERVMTPDYLYDPDNNITLGSTYLQMLQSSFFGKLKNPENRQVLSIAAYNCGPTRVKKSVVGSRDVDAMTPEQVVALVQERAPQETKDYVVRVRERMALYRK